MKNIDDDFEKIKNKKLKFLKRGSQDPFYYKEGNHSAHKHYLKQREE